MAAPRLTPRLVWAVLLVTALLGPVAHARLLTIGAGKAMVLDRAQFPPERQAQYDLFKAKCTSCHSMERPISALVSGQTPMSNEPLTRKSIKLYVTKMMRKAKSGFDKADAKVIIDFMVYARALAEEP